MRDNDIRDEPPVLASLRARVAEIGFEMSCDEKTGALLSTLLASKSRARALELGTGAGMSTAWLLHGLHEHGTLQTVEQNAELVVIAKEHLGSDQRVEFSVDDGERFISRLSPQSYDFIFADTWPGKFYALEVCLDLLSPGGLYVIDDLLPQSTWPEGHGEKVLELVAKLEARSNPRLVKMNWSTGIIIATRSR